MPASSYYDVDCILAEEELIPCTTLFDFWHLAHLDPDLVDDPRTTHLPEDSKVKLPLWAMEKWATLGFVRMSLPRHFGRKARERLEADPSQADLRKRSERFFQSGRMVVELMEKCSSKVAAALSNTPASRRNPRRNAHVAAMRHAEQEAKELRRSLLVTYSGERLRRTLDWALSSVGDDVTEYTKRLTEMERRLFERGASAASAHVQWKTYGNRRIQVNSMATKRIVTPPQERQQEERPSKRAKALS